MKEADAGHAGRVAVVDAPSSSVNARTDAVPTATSSDAPRDESFVRISTFDCEKWYEAPGFPKPTGAIQSGISEWRGGGPNGANWNVGDLRCVVGVASPCTKASIYVAIRVGTKLVAERKLDLGAGPQIDVELEIPYERWRKNLDEPLRAAWAFRVPYRTAVFRAIAQINCSAPVAASAANWKYPSVTGEATFVAGFASGE